MNFIHDIDIFVVSKLGSYAVIYFGFISYLPLLMSFSFLLFAVHIFARKPVGKLLRTQNITIKRLAIIAYGSIMAAYVGVCLYDIGILLSMNWLFTPDDSMARLEFLLKTEHVAIESAVKYLLLLTVPILLLWRSNAHLLSSFFSRPKSSYKHTVLLSCAYTFAIIFFWFVTSMTVGQPKGVSFGAMTKEFAGNISVISLFFVFILPIIIAISEEILFRGIIYVGLRDVIGPTLATVAASVLFALYHSQALGSLPLYSIYYFSAGLLLTFLYKQTGTLYPSIAVHFMVLILPVEKLLMR